MRPILTNTATLASLQATFDAIAQGRVAGNSAAAHDAVLARLADNQIVAEACGWTACVVERSGGTGPLHLEGMPPAGPNRETVPDSLGESYMALGATREGAEPAQT